MDQEAGEPGRPLGRAARADEANCPDGPRGRAPGCPVTARADPLRLACTRFIFLDGRPTPLRAPAAPNGSLAFGNTGLFTQCKNAATGRGGGAIGGNTNTCVDTSHLPGTGADDVNPGSQFPGDPGYCGSNNLLGGGTGWLTTSGDVVPGETIELRFVIWDTGDQWYDSLVLLDDFQGSVDASEPGTHQ